MCKVASKRKSKRAMPTPSGNTGMVICCVKTVLRLSRGQIICVSNFIVVSSIVFRHSQFRLSFLMCMIRDIFYVPIVANILARTTTEVA